MRTALIRPLDSNGYPCTNCPPEQIRKCENPDTAPKYKANVARGARIELGCQAFVEYITKSLGKKGWKI